MYFPVEMRSHLTKQKDEMWNVPWTEPTHQNLFKIDRKSKEKSIQK